MFFRIYNILLRLLLCTFTFHKASEKKVQSHKEYHIYSCKRCGNLFAIKKQNRQ